MKKKHSKTHLAVKLWTSGKKFDALKKFSKFKIGFSKNDIKYMQIANELAGSVRSYNFYKQIGVDPDEMLENAFRVIQKYVNNYLQLENR